MIYRDKVEDEEFINVFEKVISNPIRWSHTNQYKFSKNLDMITYTKQYIHPNLPALEIEFFTNLINYLFEEETKPNKEFFH